MHKTLGLIPTLQKEKIKAGSHFPVRKGLFSFEN
jgi:hypothetical protein